MSLPSDRAERLADGLHRQRKQLARDRHEAERVRWELHEQRQARLMLDEAGDLRWRARGLRRIGKLEAELAELEREVEALAWVERIDERQAG
jgi:hypothetical protein